MFEAIITTQTSSGQIYIGVLVTLISVSILGGVTFGRRLILKWFRRELIEPVRELKDDFRKHVRKDDKFQKTTKKQIADIQTRLPVDTH